MPLNTIPISQRTLPYDPRINANGSYTLPQYAFIPHPNLQQLSSGVVLDPGTIAGAPAAFAAPMQLQRAYPVPVGPAIYGLRATQVKVSPQG